MGLTVGLPSTGRRLAAVAAAVAHVARGRLRLRCHRAPSCHLALATAAFGAGAAQAKLLSPRRVRPSAVAPPSTRHPPLP